MSHCQECWSSTPARDYESIGEPYKAICAVKGSSCPRLHSQRFRSSSALAAGSDCPACLRASSEYGLQFVPEAHFRCCPGIFVPGQNRDVTVDCRALVSSDYHHPGGFYHHVNGYDLIAGVSHGTMPICTCQHNQSFACPSHTALIEHGAKLCTETTVPPNYKAISSLKDYTDSKVHDYSDSNFTSFSDWTPVKYKAVKSANSSSVINTPGKSDKEDGFQLDKQDTSLKTEDILEWKRKHIEQLQVQQTEVRVSENNVTDELKDFKTSSSPPSVLSMPTTTTMILTPTPPNCLCTDEDNQLKCEAALGDSTENQMLRIEHLEVELHRQQLKVKLYESMLRKHRQDMKAIQLSMQDQKLTYEEQINALQKQLLRFKEQKMNPVTLSESPQPAAGENFGATSENSGKEMLVSAGANATLEHRLARLQQEISKEEEALCSLREDMATKDHHLKTLRMTLKEISSCNCELLEKNLELEGMLHRNRNHSAGTVRGDVMENRLLKEIDSCISELNSIAMALMALASGLDPLPAFLLHGCDDGVGESGTGLVTGNGTEPVMTRLDRTSQLQQQIGKLREMVMQRILSNHYKVASEYSPKSTS